MRHIIFAFITLSLAFPCITLAKTKSDSGWYMGIGVSRFLDGIEFCDDALETVKKTLPTTFKETSCSEKSTGGRLYGGYGYPFLVGKIGAELTYWNMGTMEWDGSLVGQAVKIDSSLDGAGITAVWEVPVFKKVALLFRGGGFYWRIDTDVEAGASFGESGEDSGFEPMIGASVQVEIQKGFLLRVDWDRIENVQYGEIESSSEDFTADLMLYSVNVTFEF